MNLSKTLRYVPSRVFRTETQQYADRILLNGGSISEASLIAVDKFVGDCKAASLWNKFIEVGPFAGANLNAALVKLVYQAGGSGVLTNSNFVSGDYVETGSSAGLFGDGTKYLNTGVLASSLPEFGHLSFYLREDIVQASNRMLLGALGGSDQCWIGSLIPASQTDLRYSQAITATAAGAFVKGFYTGVREGATSLVSYRNGVSIATSSTLTSNVRPAQAIYLWGYNNGGSASARIAARGCFYSVGETLNATEAAALNTAVRALQIALNRNIN